jgi:superfamily II DNA/RNA helicase
MLGVYSSTCFHAGKGNEDRIKNLESFKKGEIRFLIVTDGVAARGIDIEGLPYVISIQLI